MDLLNIYNGLKKGDTIKLKFDNSARKAEGFGKYRVSKGKTILGKRKVERIALVNILNPKGVKYYMYQSNDKITFAVGDMGAVIVDAIEDKENLTEGATIQDLEKYFKTDLNLLRIQPEEANKFIRQDHFGNLLIEQIKDENEVFELWKDLDQYGGAVRVLYLGEHNQYTNTEILTIK